MCDYSNNVITNMDYLITIDTCLFWWVKTNYTSLAKMGLFPKEKSNPNTSNQIHTKICFQSPQHLFFKSIQSLG